MKGRKIKVDILMSTLTLVFLSLFSLILFNHLNNKSSMKETAEEFIESIGHSFIIDAETKFKFWENMASTYGPLYSEENKFSILSENMPLKLMNSTVNAFSEISSIYTGYEDGFSGQFFLVMKNLL